MSKTVLGVFEKFRILIFSIYIASAGDIRNLLITYVKQLQQEIFNFGMETFMIICVCHLLVIVENVIVNHNETSPML